MGVIPEFVNTDWKKQYAPDSELFKKYEGLISGQAIMALAEQDRKVINQMCRSSAYTRLDGKPIYLANTGAPLAGKSTILDKEIASNPKRYTQLGKADPDVWGMRFMVNLYTQYLMSPGMVANAPDFATAQQRAYDVARPASNYITNDNINYFVENRLSFAHGTTMTSPHVGKLLKSLKDAGYEIDLLVCGAEDEMRAEAAKYRSTEQGLYQATPEDVINKGLAFPQRMHDYFEFADNLKIFWRDDVTADAVHAATFSDGKIEVHSTDAYVRFTNKYDEDCVKLANPKDGSEPIRLPEFEVHEATYVSRFQQAPLAQSDFEAGAKAKPEPS